MDFEESECGLSGRWWEVNDFFGSFRRRNQSSRWASVVEVVYQYW